MMKGMMGDETVTKNTIMKGIIGDENEKRGR
jgi:hypothetical protein